MVHVFLSIAEKSRPSVTLHLSFRDSHVFGTFLAVSEFPESWKPRFVTKSVQNVWEKGHESPGHQVSGFLWIFGGFQGCTTRGILFAMFLMYAYSIGSDISTSMLHLTFNVDA